MGLVLLAIELGILICVFLFFYALVDLALEPEHRKYVKFLLGHVRHLRGRYRL